MKRMMFTAAAVAMLAGLAQAQPLTTVFTYQGILNDAGVLANGTYDLQFKLFNAAAGGAQQGATLTRSDVLLADGQLVTTLDFGAQFTGQRRWLQIEVRPGASVGAYTILPRQELTVSPNAAYAMTAGTVAAHSLDDAYDDGRTITADAGAVQVNGAGGVVSSGPVESGDTARSGVVQINAATTGNKLAAMQIFSNIGGAVQGYEEDGVTRTYALEPDAGGTGGFLSIFGAGGGSMFLDGATGVSNGPRLSLNGGGAPSDFVFDTNTTGNGSAVLPAGAVSALEMFDEPGVANAADNSVGTTLSTTATFTNVISRTITVPAAGYVIAYATLETLHTHASGTETNLLFGISDTTTSLPSTQDLGCRLPSSWASGTVLLTNNAHTVFSVAAGAHTYNVLARMNSGSGQTFDTELTLIYVPTAYGTVEFGGGRSGGGAGGEHFGRPVPAGLRGGLTPADVDQERRMEMARHLAVMAAEQEKMRAEIERLRAQVGNGR
ncbi:MAG: hypothetical protein IT436_05930 [Phycisphaerales bacterium]|nr:hypothetical protein [Phycisphaerales bacterium]